MKKIAALILIFLVGGVCYISYQSFQMIKSRKNDTFAIAALGHQATMVQNYSKYVFYYFQTGEIGPVYETINTFEKTQKALLEGGEVAIDFHSGGTKDLSSINIPAFKKEIETLNIEWEKIKNVTSSLLSLQDPSEDEMKNFSLMTDQFEKDICKLRSSLQLEYDQKILGLQKIQLIIFIVIIILFSLCAFLLSKFINLNKSLEEKVTQRTEQLKKAQDKLVDSARQAGMSEIATGVLHNVGNVLNSVNISVEIITDKMKNFAINKIDKVVALFPEDQEELSSFLSTNPKAKLVPGVLKSMHQDYQDEYKEVSLELKSLEENVLLIKNIISVQQSAATSKGLKEEVLINDLIEQAIQVNALSLNRHAVSVNKEYSQQIKLLTDKSKVLQILINLISNAKEAVKQDEHPIITIKMKRTENKWLKIIVHDNGVGIKEEDLASIFSYGFSTKKHGHGFGLHNSAIAAKDLEGTLEVESPGENEGATFTLSLPIK